MGQSKDSMGSHAAETKTCVCKKHPNDLIVALAGNPNVGKSTVFNAMTGLRQHTGNWAGKTISNAQGYCTHNKKGYVMIDIPGCYSLTPQSGEEEIAKEFLLSQKADVVVVVCAATCLERNLILALQIMEIVDRVVVCINLMDEARKNHITIDIQQLEQRLAVPVVATAARNKEGIDNIYCAVDQAIQGKGIQRNDNCADRQGKPAQYYVEAVESLCKDVVGCDVSNKKQSDFGKDKIFTGKYTGFPIMILLLMCTFWITIWGANYISEMLQIVFRSLERMLYNFLVEIQVPITAVQLLVEGVYRVCTWVISVMLPPMAIFFPLFTLLEDSGYLPRIAFNLDKCFHKCHACGKQSLTMCQGLGCNAAAVVGCRIIDSKRERLLAIITNSFIPCNGRFPMLIILITMFLAGSGSFANVCLAATLLAFLIVFGVVMTFFVSAFLSKTVLKGVPSCFVMELPPYRRPRLGAVVIRSVFDRTLFVLGRAIVAAAPAGAVIWIMANYTVGGVTLLAHCASFLDPFGRLLGMDGVILFAFLLGLPANEIVVPIIIMTYMASGSLTEIDNIFFIKDLLVQNGWTWITAVCTIFFCLFHWPCATTCMTIYKETKIFYGFLIIVMNKFIAFFVVAIKIENKKYRCNENRSGDSEGKIYTFYARKIWRIWARFDESMFDVWSFGSYDCVNI